MPRTSDKYTPTQLAEMAGVSVVTIYNHLKRTRLKDNDSKWARRDIEGCEIRRVCLSDVWFAKTFVDTDLVQPYSTYRTNIPKFLNRSVPVNIVVAAGAGGGGSERIGGQREKVTPPSAALMKKIRGVVAQMPEQEKMNLIRMITLTKPGK